MLVVRCNRMVPQGCIFRPSQQPLCVTKAKSWQKLVRDNIAGVRERTFLKVWGILPQKLKALKKLFVIESVAFHRKEKISYCVYMKAHSKPGNPAIFSHFCSVAAKHCVSTGWKLGVMTPRHLSCEWSNKKLSCCRESALRFRRQ